MAWVYLYFALSVVIAFASTTIFFSTAITKANVLGLKNSVTENAGLARITFFFFSMLFAPILFVILSFNSMSEKFVDGLYSGLFNE